MDNVPQEAEPRDAPAVGRRLAPPGRPPPGEAADRVIPDFGRRLFAIGAHHLLDFLRGGFLSPTTIIPFL